METEVCFLFATRAEPLADRSNSTREVPGPCSIDPTRQSFAFVSRHVIELGFGHVRARAVRDDGDVGSAWLPSAQA